MKFPMIPARLYGQELPTRGAVGMGAVEIAVNPKEE